MCKGVGIRRLYFTKDVAMAKQTTRRGDQALAAREWALCSRIAQGLPPHVYDTVTLANIGVIVRAGLRSAQSLDAPHGNKSAGVKHTSRLGPVDRYAVQERSKDTSALVQRQVRPGVSHPDIGSGQQVL